MDCADAIRREARLGGSGVRDVVGELLGHVFALEGAIAGLRSLSREWAQRKSFSELREEKIGAEHPVGRSRPPDAPS